MYCFAKFCCMCLCTEKHKRSFININTICRDNMSLFDKITYCLPEELQDILKYKIRDAKICNSCRDQITRMYKFLGKTKENLNIIRGYAETLSENNFKKTDSMLQVSLNSPPKKKNRMKELLNYTESIKEANDILPSPVNYTESNKETDNILASTINYTESKEIVDEIYEVRIPLPNIIEDSFKNSDETDNCIDIKPVIINSDEDKINEKPDDFKIKSEFSIKIELNVPDEDKFLLQGSELLIKEEFFIPECNRSSPVDIKSIINSSVEETFSMDTLQLSEPVQNETVLQESSNAAEEVVNTSQEEKRKKPSPLPCPLCKCTFYSANAMARHLSKNHNKSRFNCTVCNLSFKSEMVLKRHVLIHSDQLYNACMI